MVYEQKGTTPLEAPGNHRESEVNKIVNIYSTQGGGYAYYDELYQAYRFAQAPPGAIGYRAMDRVPNEWGIEGPVGKATLRVEDGVPKSVLRMDFLQGQNLCPYCLRQMEDCDCCDDDV